MPRQLSLRKNADSLRQNCHGCDGRTNTKRFPSYTVSAWKQGASSCSSSNTTSKPSFLNVSRGGPSKACPRNRRPCSDALLRNLHSAQDSSRLTTRWPSETEVTKRKSFTSDFVSSSRPPRPVHEALPTYRGPYLPIGGAYLPIVGPYLPIEGHTYL